MLFKNNINPKKNRGYLNRNNDLEKASKLLGLKNEEKLEKKYMNNKNIIILLFLYFFKIIKLSNPYKAIKFAFISTNAVPIIIPY